MGPRCLGAEVAVGPKWLGSKCQGLTRFGVDLSRARGGSGADMSGDLLFDHLPYPLCNVSVWGPCFKMTTPDFVLEWLRISSYKTMLTRCIGQHIPQIWASYSMHGTSWDADFGITMPIPTTVLIWPRCSWHSGKQCHITSRKTGEQHETLYRVP